MYRDQKPKEILGGKSILNGNFNLECTINGERVFLYPFFANNKSVHSAMEEAMRNFCWHCNFDNQKERIKESFEGIQETIQTLILRSENWIKEYDEQVKKYQDCNDIDAFLEKKREELIALCAALKNYKTKKIEIF